MLKVSNVLLILNLNENKASLKRGSFKGLITGCSLGIENGEFCGI